jgi:hypothetical protein
MHDGEAAPCVRGGRFGGDGGATCATVEGLGIGVMTGDVAALATAVEADARGDERASRWHADNAAVAANSAAAATTARLRASEGILCISMTAAERRHAEDIVRTTGW